MFFNHRTWEIPVGKWEALQEDTKGLFVRGQLTPGHSGATDLKAAMQHGTVEGMSVGFWVSKDDYSIVPSGGRIFKNVSRLREVSVCTFPANELAGVSAMKSAEGIETLRDVENWLRDSVGVSKSQAVGLIARFKSAIRSDHVRKITMSELEQIQKALEASQAKVQQLFDAQKAEIESTGQISKQLQSDIVKVQAEMTKSGQHLFDLEQKLSSAGALIQPMQVPGIVMPGLRRLVIRDLLAQGRISSNSLEYVREKLFTNSAKPVKEKVMDDTPVLQSYVNNRLLYGLALEEEAQLLNGNGAGDNLKGINTVATAYDTTLNAKGDTKSDMIAHAVFQVTESEFSASGIILNPRDWHNIALLKDGDGRYIFGGPQAFASNIMWGLPVVPTRAQAQGTFTVGGFDLASQVWDRMDATIEVSREDRDNFVKNMLTILCEDRLALAHYRPQAIIKGAFAAPAGG
uniref:Phage major capsid protein n=1 Tax=Glossina brevipalpis TaxID=37001 RepID=A0A1A9VZ49_9MUSC